MKDETAKSVLQWLLVLLDQVDFTKGNCNATDMVAAVLAPSVLENARAAAMTAQKEINDEKA